MSRLRAVLAPHAAALLVLVGLCAYVALSADQHGISNDEEVQHVYGRLLVDFYASGFADRSAFGYKNLYLYGGLFDLIAAGLERVIPMNVWDLRHLLSGAFGLLGLAGTWLLARLLAGEVAALLALLVLALTGAWSGAMFTHTKDVPFASGMIWAVYFTTRIARGFPALRTRDLVGLGIALGCAFGLRVGAVFAVFYLGVTLLVAAWLTGGDARGRLALIGRGVVGLLPAALLAFALMSLFWPWAVQSPGNLVEAMTTFARFSFELYTILDGVVMKNGEVPGHYLLSYLLVRLPELFLLGVALAMIGALRALPRVMRNGAARRAALPWAPVALAAGFPLAYTLLAAPPLYNGLRHFTFVLPPLAVLAGAGLVYAWRCAADWPRLRVVGAAACIGLAAVHLALLVRLHPYEYVAYNAMAGGLQGTERRWEQDYWSDSLRAATERLNAFVADEGLSGHRYTVAVCAESVQASAWLAPGLEVTRDWRAADFFLATTHMDCDSALQGRIVAKVAREGVVLAVARDRRALADADREPRLMK